MSYVDDVNFDINEDWNNKDVSENWLCRRCLKHSVTVAQDLIVNENPHNMEDEDEDTCVYTEAELLCEQAIVRIKRNNTNTRNI
jgi:hypothetical protein